MTCTDSQILTWCEIKNKQKSWTEMCLNLTTVNANLSYVCVDIILIHIVSGVFHMYNFVGTFQILHVSYLYLLFPDISSHLFTFKEASIVPVRVFHFTCLYMVRNDENKDVQSTNNSTVHGVIQE